MIGKFCSLFAPLSASCAEGASFGVTPSAPRSMPRCRLVVPFEKIELPRMALPNPAVADSCTPSSPLKAIVSPSPGWVPPMVLNPEPAPVKVIPAPPLPRALVPFAFVPIRLPSTRSLLLFENAIPVPLLPEIRLMSAGVDPPTVRLFPLVDTPLAVFPRARVPLTSVPMKLPTTLLLVPPCRSRP